MIENEFSSSKHDQFVSSVSNLMKKSKTISPLFIITVLDQVQNLANLPFQYCVTFSPSVLVCVQGESLFVDMEIPQRLSFSEIFLITINENGDGFVIMNQIFSTQGI